MSDDPARAVMGVRPETFLAHWRSMRDAKDDQADAVTSVARVKKAAKRDGVDLDVVKTLEMLSKMEADERDGFMSKLYCYSKWLELPLGQFAMGIEVSTPKKGASDEFKRWQAGQDGFAAGKSGAPRESNPHRNGSAEHVAWDKKWKPGVDSSNRRNAKSMVAAANLAKAAAANEEQHAAVN